MATKSTVNAIYVPDNDGWRKIRFSTEILGFCMEEADLAKVFAEDISPRSRERKYDKYAESFILEPETVYIQPGGWRYAARVTNTADHAAAVEFGNRQTPKAQRIMDKAAQSISIAEELVLLLWGPR